MKGERLFSPEHEDHRIVPEVSLLISYKSLTYFAPLTVSGTHSCGGNEPNPVHQQQKTSRSIENSHGSIYIAKLPEQTSAWKNWGDLPVGEEKGGSSGEANVQPVCSSLGSFGLVFCHVGCTTDKPITSSRPCRQRDSKSSSHPQYIRLDISIIETWPRGIVRPGRRHCTYKVNYLYTHLQVQHSSTTIGPRARP